MIGQTTLLEHLRDLTRKQKLPRFSIFYGPRGAGKKLLAQEIMRMMNASMMEIRELKVDNMRMMIEQAQTLRSPFIYLLPDADEMTTQAANALLKFLEEPPKNAYVIMTVRSIDNVLSTIQSRASVYQMEKYTKAEMREYVSGEVEDGALALLLFRTCETPGQVKYLLEFGDDAVDDLMELTEKVAYSIDKANAANVFKISTQFRLDDIDLFMSFLRLHLSDMFQKAYPKSDKKTMHRVIEMLRVISHNEGLFKNKGLNKSNLLEMFLIELREAAMA